MPRALSPLRVTVVVLTYNRCEEVLNTLEKLQALSDSPEIIVVDNASSDATSARIAANYPTIRLVTAQQNLGAAGRNLGVAKVTTPYVAFCDDDTWWEEGSLTRAEQILDNNPRVAILAARIIVGDHGATDETCLLMQRSPLDSTGLPGPSLVGYMAGASVFRTEVFKQVGGYEPRLFIGGEEALVALDVLSNGFSIVYIDTLVLHHNPSRLRNESLRRYLLARNAAWIAWMRLPLGKAWNDSKHAFRTIWREQDALTKMITLFAGIAWAIARRRPVPSFVNKMRDAVRKAEDDFR